MAGRGSNEREDYPQFHPDRHEHGKAPQHLDDDQLAELAEEERVEAGLDDFDPDEVPPATDTPPLPTDIRETEVYEEERAELRRQINEGEYREPSERDPFPPTRYED
jgi:hypothetical protein